jgi:hypothetical protein
MKLTTTNKTNLINYLDDIQACNDIYTEQEVNDIANRIQNNEWKNLKEFALYVYSHTACYLNVASKLVEAL